MIYLDKFKSGNKIKQELYYSFVPNLSMIFGNGIIQI
ncbi:hypothetical protein FN3_01585 [Fusobacterium nucleatum subsp. nucleatum ATCC 25586]|nr:hypothetical protein HMPREF1539_00849 [Fusobacterium nucleatum CTI-2]